MRAATYFFEYHVHSCPHLDEMIFFVAHRQFLIFVQNGVEAVLRWF